MSYFSPSPTNRSVFGNVKSVTNFLVSNLIIESKVGHTMLSISIKSVLDTTVHLDSILPSQYRQYLYYWKILFSIFFFIFIRDEFHVVFNVHIHLQMDSFDKQGLSMNKQWTNWPLFRNIQSLGRKFPVVWVMLVATWVWSLVLSLPPLFGWGSFKPGKK